MEKPFFKSYDMMPAVSEERLNYLRAKVRELMDAPQPEQRTPEWYAMRDGMLTASDWGTILGENHYEQPEAILYKKCGSREEQFTGNAATRWGQKYESVAIQIYEKRNRVKVIEFGLIRHPEIPFLGASPDGITDDGVMVEIKCPSSRRITGETPRHYWCQVQAQLEVCRLDRCDFLECEIEEYISQDAYFADSVETNHGLGKLHGKEKGCVLVFKQDDNNKYSYAPLGLDQEQLNSWCQTETARRCELTPVGPTFWRLKTISCVPIYRDEQWFAEALPKLSEFWTRIEDYRAGKVVLLPPKKEPSLNHNLKGFNPFKKTTNSPQLNTSEPTIGHFNPFKKTTASVPSIPKAPSAPVITAATPLKGFNPFKKKTG